MNWIKAENGRLYNLDRMDVIYVKDLETDSVKRYQVRAESCEMLCILDEFEREDDAKERLQEIYEEFC